MDIRLEGPIRTMEQGYHVTEPRVGRCGDEILERSGPLYPVESRSPVSSSYSP